ncbi:hypothetical protein K501DRAFT_265756 [Backusella circina FSU 941]|nr:hypothetical protein K501DRAFT_265756 [Backusella circina FSU 941]
MYEWKLPRQWMNKIQIHWHSLCIDALASRVGKRLLIFWSHRMDLGAAATDAFMQTWPKQELFFHSPWKLIPHGEISQFKIKNVVPSDNGLSIFIDQSKEGGIKFTHIGYQVEQLAEYCLVRTWKLFMYKTKYLQHGPDAFLFLYYIEHHNNKFRPAKAASWLKQILKDSWIYTTLFQAHSFNFPTQYEFFY